MSVDSPTPRANSSVSSKPASRRSRSRRGAAARRSPRAPRGTSPSPAGSGRTCPWGLEGAHGVSRHIPRRGAAVRSRAGGHLPQERVGGALAADGGLGAVAGQHHGQSSSGRHTRASDSSISAWSPPGRSVRPMEPAKSRSPEKQHRRDVALLGHPEGHRALGMARRVVDGEVQAGQRQLARRRPAPDVVGLARRSARPERHADRRGRGPSPGRSAGTGPRGGSRRARRGRRRPGRPRRRGRCGRG